MSNNTEIKKDYLVDLVFMYVLTPVHMGSGHSLSYVDLPVQREKVTSYPVLWASGIKGVFRTNFFKYIENKRDNEKLNEKLVDIIFGPEDSEDSFSSCISITDAKILFYPVRSLKGVFAYVTCPFVIKRFLNELSSFYTNSKNISNLPNLLNNQLNLDDDKVIIENDSVLKIDNNSIALEEFVFEIKNDQNNFLKNLLDIDFFKNLEDFINDNKFVSRVVLVSDNVFKDFVNYSVEIRTRIRIDQVSGVTKEGALFTQEFIPSDSIFYSFIFTKNSFDKNNKLSKDQINQKINEFLNDYNVLQFGSDETLGKGLIKLKNINLK